jgi:hypothetical protein
MASLMKKVKKKTKDKIIHSAFSLGHDILTAIEEQMVEAEEEEDHGTPTGEV